MFRGSCVSFKVTLALWAAICGLVQGQDSTNFSAAVYLAPAGQVGVRWTNQSAATAVTVQSRPSLHTGLWLNASHTNPWPVAGGQWLDFSTPSSTRFYRVLQVPASQRGTLLGNTSLGSQSLAYLRLLAQSMGLPFTPSYGVGYFRLQYETVDPQGARAVATGLLCLPTGATGPLRVFSYQHGTILSRLKAPSSDPTGGEGVLGIIAASRGYAVALPDYLGLGTGSAGLHPYHHAVSEANAAIDMLRATRAYCQNRSISLSAKLFLGGYSQGGHATMALHRELERYYTNEFKVTACAPMAGAYDLSGVTATDFLSGREMPNPYYFAFLLGSYQQAYGLGASLAELLVPPYDTTLPPLLDGNHSESELDAAMPRVPVTILKPGLMADFQTNANNVLRVALRDNDLTQWRPVAPMRLWHCSGDQDVAFANSQAATNQFYLQGVRGIQLINTVPEGDHGACVQPSVLDALTWFDTFP